MQVSDQILQSPAPGQQILCFRGDDQTFVLSLKEPQKGRAWLRTNIGHGDVRKIEIIEEVTLDRTVLNRDWFDFPMEQVDDRTFEVTIGLCEVGHFEAKCLFLPQGSSDPIWPVGDNTVINVEPARTCCANIIYNAFVRQFGQNKSGTQEVPRKIRETISGLDEKGYAVIPPSGTFRDLKKELDFIVGELGCRIIQLLPIHPTPTTYGRMGRFGSPYAALSFTGIDPALAVFDPAATPTEQFIELVDAIHERNAGVIIDIAINHTGWAASLHNAHPEWLVRDKEGRIEAPGAWGVVWEDLTKLDYSHKDLWEHMAGIFLLWCRRGVDGFRCDAGYMIPTAAWKFIVAVVRQQFPDTIFLLEGLGGKLSLTRDLLNIANLNWAYSELFQNYDRKQIEQYLHFPLSVSQEAGVMIHFAETHDNLRLAQRSKVYARMRTALSALCSQHGGFGFANGVEWFAMEKIDVHDAGSLNWGASENQVDLIRRLNLLLKKHVVFQDKVSLSLIQQGPENYIALLRHHLPSGKKILVLINLDVDHGVSVQWPAQMFGDRQRVFMDLISGKEVAVTLKESLFSCRMSSGGFYSLTTDRGDFHMGNDSSKDRFAVPLRVMEQCSRAKAMDVYRFYNGSRMKKGFHPDAAARDLLTDPRAFCRQMSSSGEEARVITWNWPHDTKREVMVPPEHFLLVRAKSPFRAKIIDRTGGKEFVLAGEDSLLCEDGSCFALFSPLASSENHRNYTLELSVYSDKVCCHVSSPLLFISSSEQLEISRYVHRHDLLRKDFVLLSTNGRGAMMRAHVSWGKLTSRYDGLLAANLNFCVPEDRWMMFTRCRAWVVFQGYSVEMNSDCLDSFNCDENFRGYWRFHIPCGQGQHVMLTIAMEMADHQNAIRISFFRHKKGGSRTRLPDSKEIKLILRPDIEDRNFHETTKAFSGPEANWPGSVTEKSHGFIFKPHESRVLQVNISEGQFFSEPEWFYMVHRPLEADRGLDPDSDLFSPGYFSGVLKGDHGFDLTAQVFSSEKTVPVLWEPIPSHVMTHFSGARRAVGFQEALAGAIKAFVVTRDHLFTVIAGYPWFLDWGRDTLIFVRGLIAAGNTETAKSILIQFGCFEKDGTLANMIRGEDAGNRDTSDAPLWLFVACSDLIADEKHSKFLDADCKGRTMKQILISMGHSIVSGTPNGIRMDGASGLVFSPSHFTWMDTNHPASTPRQGYPIEIQALWHFALSFLARIDEPEKRGFWKEKAAQVGQSIIDLYYMEKAGFLSDCLHASPYTPARQAEPDDALRPNQLLAITLGAVKDKQICQKVLDACQMLLVPGGIRSLGDRKVSYPLSIIHNGKLLNSPHDPYQGTYAGDEDTRRKPAYHNGTAWTWIFPSFSEAWVKVYGDAGKAAALAWLRSSAQLLSDGCVGHIPEILDGDYPHAQRGCDAQAWGASELLRVWLDIVH